MRAPDPSRLDPAARERALAELGRRDFDVVVVGGGVTGAGAALDAATRGLEVALLEQRDWAAGTSSRSSKLIHGGVRYLEQLEFGLVREALREQTRMLDRLCPHLVRPVPFLYPLRTPVLERLYVGTGMLLYDLLAGRRALPRHRHLSRRAALRRFPGLAPESLCGAILYYDAQVDDARHTLTLVRTAACFGALALSSARVVGLEKSGARVTGLRVRCLESGAEVEVRAQRVINATGVWTDRVQGMGGRGRIRVRASKGIHLVVPRDRIPGDSGLILRTERSVLFVIPWDGHWIIGTTDTDWNLDLAHPAASARDIDYLLERVNRALARPISRDDIEGVYAGLRPLLSGESEDTSKLSREHAVSESVSGLVTVAGGKYTTYRVMARDAVDVAARGLGRSVPPSCTHRIPLLGGAGFPGLWPRRAELARGSGLPLEQVERLLRRYGTRIRELLALIRERPELGEPLPGGGGYLRAEIVYAAAFEGALHLDDVLTRRTRISIETADRGMEAAPAVAQLVGEVLGWDEATREREIVHYEARVRAERESNRMPDDHTADAARLGAPDVRTLGREGPGASLALASGAPATRRPSAARARSAAGAAPTGGTAGAASGGSRAAGVESSAAADRPSGPPIPPGSAVREPGGLLPDPGRPGEGRPEGSAPEERAASEKGPEGGGSNAGDRNGPRTVPDSWKEGPVVEVQVSEQVAAPADSVWGLLADFGGVARYSPGIERCEVRGEGVGAVRTLTLPGGSTLEERLESLDPAARRLSYSIVSGPIPVKNYLATIEVREDGEGCRIDWGSRFEPVGLDDDRARSLIEGVYRGAIAGVRKALGAGA